MMNRHLIILIIILFVNLNLFGQNKITKDSTLINAEIIEDTYIGILKNHCYTDYYKEIKAGKIVQVINVNRCKTYTSEYLYYEIALDSNTYWIECNKLSIDTTYISDFENSSKERIEKIRNIGIYYSWLMYKKRLFEAISFIEKASTKGIVIYDWNIYDESEYTDGTGFKITFFNPTKQTIKYIWITVSGYNAVDDKVADPITSHTSKTVKCIGPLDANNQGSYEFDYFWHTDIVQSAKITQVKIQYMNGSTKVITNPMNLVLNDEFKELLEE